MNRKESQQRRTLRDKLITGTIPATADIQPKASMPKDGVAKKTRSAESKTENVNIPRKQMGHMIKQMGRNP